MYRQSDWDEYLNRDEVEGEYVPSTSPKTTEELRLADLWIGDKTQLDEKGSELVNDLERDLFWRLFRLGGMQKDPVPAERIVNAKIIDWLTQGGTWENTHALTCNRRLVSSNSASIMTESLLNDPEVRRLIEEQKEVEQQQQQAEQAMEQAAQAEGAGDGQAAANLRQQAQAHQQAADDKAQALASDLDKLTDSVKGRAMASGVNQNGNDEAKETAEEMGAWGMEDGDGSELDMTQLKSLLEQVKQHGVSDLAKMIGRARGVAQRTLSTRKHLEIVLTDAGMTQNLEDIFSDELMMLSPRVPDPARSIQLSELLDNGLLGTVKAVETKEEGDLVIAVDGSGSMSGEREYLAKALTLGICEAACENGQNWRAFTFGSHQEVTDVITPDTELSTRLKWSTFLFGGGTDFDMALQKAMEEVENMEDPSSADIVMITDGQAGINPATRVKLQALKEKFGVRLIGILVDTGYQDLGEVADATILANSDTAIEKAAEELSKNLWK